MKKSCKSYLPKAQDGLSIEERAILKAKERFAVKEAPKSAVSKAPTIAVKKQSPVKQQVTQKQTAQVLQPDYSSWKGPSGFSHKPSLVKNSSDVINSGIYTGSYNSTSNNSLQNEEDDVDIVDNLKDYAKRAVGLYLNIGNEDPTVNYENAIIDNKFLPNSIVNLEEEKDYNSFQKINIPSDTGLFSYIRQGLNSDSLDYYTGPSKITYESNKDKSPFGRQNVEGIGHHLIMSVAKDLTDFTNPADLDKASRLIINTTPDDNYIPVVRKHPGEKIKLTYRKKSDLVKDIDFDSSYLYGDPSVSSPFRLEQWKFGDLDFDNLGKTNVFKVGIKGVYDKKNKKYNRSLVTSGGLEAYGRFSGASVVFIFKDPSTKKEVVKEVTGPLDMIRKEGNKISSDYNVDKNDITVGVFDAGSVNYKRAADENFNMKPARLYQDETIGSYAGSSLLIPKGGKFKHGGSMITKKQNGGYLGNNTSEKFSQFYNAIKSQYPNVPDEELLNIWEETYKESTAQTNPFADITPLIPGSQFTFEEYGVNRKDRSVPIRSYLDKALSLPAYPLRVEDDDTRVPFVSGFKPTPDKLPNRSFSPRASYSDFGPSDLAYEEEVKRKPPTSSYPTKGSGIYEQQMFDENTEKALNNILNVPTEVEKERSEPKKQLPNHNWITDSERLRGIFDVPDNMEIAYSAPKGQLGGSQMFQKPTTSLQYTFPIDRNTDPTKEESRINTPSSNPFGVSMFQKTETPFINTLRMTGENAPMTSYVDNIQGYGTELNSLDSEKIAEPESDSSFAQRAFDFLPSGQNILLGAGVANSLLTRRQDNDRFRRNYREPGQEMSRGDWTTNQGILKPDRLGYFDKFSIGTGSMKMGGEVEMTDDEIYEFLAAGGELEFMD